MRNASYFSVLLFALSFFLFSGSCEKKVEEPVVYDWNTPAETENQIDVKPYTFTGDYKDLWTQVDSLERAGLYQSALNVVKEINTQANKDNNAPEIVKCAIFTIKYNSYIEEEEYILAIANLSRIANEADTPLKQLIHSITAETYWRYYQQNRWKFMNRTQTVDFDNKDIRTWDLKRLSDQINKEYLLSVEHPEVLKVQSVLNFKAILLYLTNESEKMRPTLYDFLANRAIDYFENTEMELSRPADQFSVQDDAFFGDADAFLKISTFSQDTLSNARYATILYQDLTRIRKNDPEPTAFVALELRRLNFAYTHSRNELKDEQYMLALTKLAARYPQHPSWAEIQFKKASLMVRLGNGVKDKENPYYLYHQKAHELCKEAIKRFPESYGANACRTLISQIESKSISMVTEMAYEPNKKGRFLVNFRNVDTLYYKVVESEWFFEMNERLYKEDPIDRLLKLKEVRSWSAATRNPGDFNDHSTEVLLDGLPKGYYYVLASPDKNFAIHNNAICYVAFWVSDLAYSERRSTDGSLQVFVSNRSTGKALPGVKLTVYEQKYSYTSREYQVKSQESYTSDAHGNIKLRPREDYRSIFIGLKQGDDEFVSGHMESLYRQYNEREPYSSTTFFTDRSIYRPGQTIYFKGIRLHHDGQKHSIQPGKKTKVTFYDANSQAVASVDLVTNEYGTFSGSFTAPSGGMNGYMQIRDEYGNHGIRVEEYKRPKFEVDFDPVKGIYKLNEPVHVVGKAKAYAGSNIDGAKVQYRITRSAFYPGWMYYRWSYIPSLQGATEMKNGETVTDENGNFSIDFKAVPDPSVNQKYLPNFVYTISADVTDMNGETRSSSQTVIVGSTALSLSINVPDELETSGKSAFPITAANLNGEKIPTKGTMRVALLKEPEGLYRDPNWERPDIQSFTKEEFHKLFPNDVYGDEQNIQNWKEVKEVFRTNFDTEKSDTLKIPGLKGWAPGRYKIEAVALDSFGTEVKDIHFVTLTNSTQQAFNLSEIWKTAQLKTLCEPGETAEILVASGCDELTVLYEIEQQGSTVKSELIQLKKEQRVLKIPVKEEDRGGFNVHLSAIKNGRIYTQSFFINVPYTNKQLEVKFETFRDKLLPGAEEEWKLRVKGLKGDKVAAELLVSMYDASLDAFSSNGFYLFPYTNNYSGGRRSSRDFGGTYSQLYQYDWNPYVAFPSRNQLMLNWFGVPNYVYYGGSDYWDRSEMYEYDFDGATEEIYRMPNTPVALEHSLSAGYAQTVTGTYANAVAEDESGVGDSRGRLYKKAAESPDSPEREQTRGPGKDLSAIEARTNLNETAFFYPHLETDANGDVLLRFKMPEALTRWKMIGLAHTKDLKIGTFEKEVVTQKELMVQPNAPRFFREGDQMQFTAKVSNLTEEDLDGTAQLFLFDALTMQPVDALFENNRAQVDFTAKKGQSAPLSWNIRIPEGVGMVSCRVVAQAKNHTDGEESAIPVLSNRMLVTESMPLPSKGIGSKEFSFDKLINSGGSSSLRHHSVTLEYTSNPAWYAVQAMPYMMEYPHECAEQTFTRYYANAIASNIVNSSPKIKQVFESWKQSSPDAFLSNLQKNEELKSVVLEETPWVLDANSESERKKRVALLFDLNKMDNELSRTIRKLEKMQVSNGGWPWFPGMEDSRYITQHIVTGMGHLDHLGVKNVREDQSVWKMVKKGVNYLDDRLVEDLNYLKKHAPNYKNEQHISQLQVQYLYARSYFKDVPLDDRTREAFDYYRSQAAKYWTKFDLYSEGMIALAEQRFDNPTLAKKVMASVKERALQHDEMGMYWKDNVSGYYWYQAPIETQALLIEAFDEVTDDTRSVEEMKIWLLKQKQTTDWKTTKATAEACYALLLRGSSLLENTESVEIKINGKVLDPKAMGATVEAGTGYFKTSWKGKDVQPELGKVTVTRKTEGVSWGAMYWQYFEDMDKITGHETNLKLNKQLFLVKNTASGPVMTPVTETTKLQPGDKIRVRVELRTDRNMEYVHMKDHRAAGFEPINVLSRYKWQDGLGYYESTRDAATHFFFDYLPKGTHVFEYDLRVSHSGDFSNGVTTIQCMYAPEFTSHSKGIRVKVGK